MFFENLKTSGRQNGVRVDSAQIVSAWFSLFAKITPENYAARFCRRHDNLLSTIRVEASDEDVRIPDSNRMKLVQPK